MAQEVRHLLGNHEDLSSTHRARVKTREHRATSVTSALGWGKRTQEDPGDFLASLASLERPGFSETLCGSDRGRHPRSPSTSSLPMHVNMHLYRHEHIHRHTYTPPLVKHLGIVYNELAPHKTHSHLQGRTVVAGVPCTPQKCYHRNICSPVSLKHDPPPPMTAGALGRSFCTE